MEMVQAKASDKIIQRFEWTWDNREIWLDGRKLPKVEDYLPRFNGYSVGKWEGDTLVVTTNGLDDRQWLDQYGFPVSEKASSGRTLGSSQPESPARENDPDGSAALHQTLASQHESLDIDPERQDVGRRMGWNPRGSMRPVG